MAHYDLSDLRAIVVDDSAYMCRLFRTMLYGFGLRDVVEAHDGADALEKLNTNAIDLMVLDWEMPVLDGAELVRLIRKPGHPMAYMPIIVVTGYSPESRARLAIKLGVNDVLIKPCSPRALYERVIDCVVNPRPFVNSGDYFGPKPRGEARDVKAGSVVIDADLGDFVAL
ncbi:MAG: response regulator [Devosiaceae bacterium]|nr:response regulator [Devosiaceae bacterium MH13]